VPDTFLPLETVRAAPDAPVVASGKPAGAVCPICGRLLTGRQRSACSPKHRAALCRRKRVPLPVAEYQDIRASLTAALEAVWEAKATLERYGG
jgi:hypothetical protein